MGELDGRTREARLIKARKQRKEVFHQLRKCQITINVPELAKAIKGAQNYYLIKSQWLDNEYHDLTRNGLINHIRHCYTNYADYLSILRSLDLIPFIYRLTLGYKTELKAYKWLKRRFNRAIELGCHEILKQFEDWQNEQFEDWQNEIRNAK